MKHIRNPFNIKKVSKKLQVLGSINSLLITKTGRSGWSNAAYGSNWIPSMGTNNIIKWTFKCTSQSADGSNMIGVVTNKHHLNKEIHPGAQHSYLFYSDGSIKKDGTYVKQSIINYKIGDTISFVLDLKHSTISIDKNNGEMKDTIVRNLKKGPNIKYTLVVSIYHQYDQLVFVNSSNLNTTLDDQKQQYQSMFVQAVNTTSHSNELQLEKEQNKLLQQRIHTLNKKIYALENDKTQMAQTIQTLTNSLLQYQIKTLDVTLYESWDCDQVFIWIMSLGKRYKKYENVLKNNLQKHKVKGKHLKRLNAGNIGDLGIDNSEDKKILIESIEELNINQNIKHVQDNNMNEGHSSTAYI